MKLSDEIRITGDLTLRVFEKGKLKSEETFRNLVVATGRQAIAKLLGGTGTGQNEITNIGFGTSGSAEAPADTALANEFSKPHNGATFPATNQVQFSWSLEEPENNGVTIQEYGLLCADGSLFSRKVSGAIAKTSDIRLEGDWTLTV